MMDDGRAGGGVGILYKSAISLCLLSSNSTSYYTHFKHMDCESNTGESIVRLAIIYSPPPSRQHGFRNDEFFNQWSSYLSDYAICDKEALILGDLNFYLDFQNDTDAQHFMDSISSCGLQQHVHEPTHVLGHRHTFDVVISRDFSVIVSYIVVSDPGLCDHTGKLTKDHFAVIFTTTLKSQHLQ